MIRAAFLRRFDALVLLVWMLAGLLFFAPLTVSAEVKIFRQDSRDGFLAGELDDVSVDPFGALTLARALRPVAIIEEPFVYGAAATPDGWVLGTGNSGRVLEVGPSGSLSVLYEAEQLEVFALWTDPDGTVFAGTSPYGKVIRVTDEGSEEVFDPPETYIWDLERDSQGRLLVATGLNGRIYRLAAGENPGADAEVIFESPDSHVRSLQTVGDDLLVGTAGQGLILRLDAKGQARTLYDALQPEVLTFAARPDGRAYAALLATEASLVDLGNGGQAETGDSESGEVGVSIAQETIGTRAAGANGPRSIVIEIAPDGAIKEAVRFEDETVHALMWHQDELWIGTGQQGKLYRFSDERLVLERTLDEHQIIALVPGSDSAAVVTTNTASVYRLDTDYAESGTYTSAVLDAVQPAGFGSFFWRGEQPKKSAVRFAFRSGMSLQPDATWSVWSEPAEGPELGLRDMPTGRYVQWRAELGGGGKVTPTLTLAELSYRQLNQRPVIQSLEVLDPGQILVPNNFNPSNQTFEPWNPNREGIFTTLKPASESDDSRLKTLWKKGYRTLRWQAEDPNEDTLNYRLEFRAEGASDWLPVIDELSEVYYSFDSTVIPDGTYRFRLSAWDHDADDGSGMHSERVSGPVVIDHSPPRLVEARRTGGSLEIRLEDGLSPMRQVMYSVDAQEWREAPASDGLLDGRREQLRLEVPEGARMVLLRVTDAALNVVTLNVLDALKP